MIENLPRSFAVTATQRALGSVLRRRKLVFWTVVLCLVAAALYWALAPRRYSAVARMYVQPASYRPEPGRRFAEGGGPGNFLGAQRAVVGSTPVMAMVVADPQVRQSQVFAGQKNVLAFLKSQVRVSVGRDDILSVEFSAANAEDAARVANAIVDAYAAYQQRYRQSPAMEMLKLIAEKKAQAEADIAQKSADLANLKKSAGAVSFDPRDSAAFAALAKLKDQLLAARMETLSAESAQREALAIYGSDPEQLNKLEAFEKSGPVLSEADQDPVQARAAMLELQQRLGQLQRTYGPAHPQVASAQNRLQELRMIQVVAAKRRVTAAQLRQDQLQLAISEQQRVADDFAARAAEFARLEGDLKRLERHADLLENQFKEVRPEQQAAGLMVQILDRAVAEDKPTWPDGWLIMGVAMASGLALGSLLAVVRELSDHRLYVPEQVKATLGLPVLGTLPRMGATQTESVRAQKVRYDPGSDVAQACRAIRTAVQFVDAHLKVMLVASATAHEGKTTLATNLAILWAQCGKRVLLVDGNLRQPALHRLFDVDEHVGLVSILLDEENFEHAIQGTSVEGLDLLTTGPVPPDPVELVNSSKFNELLDTAAARYDMVILDSPSLSAGPEARILGASCDAVILAVRAGRTDRRSAQRAHDGLVNVGARVLGVVVNDLPRGRSQELEFFDLPGSPVPRRRPGHSEPDEPAAGFLRRAAD